MERVSDKQLLKEIKFLSTMVKGASNVPPHDMNFAIHDAFLALKKKMDEGTVPSGNFDYERYKGYMFLTIKNFVLLYFQKQKYLKNSNTDYIEDKPLLENTHCTDQVDLDLIKLVHRIGDDLKGRDKEMYKLMLEGYRQNELALIFKLSETTINDKVHRFRDYVKARLEGQEISFYPTENKYMLTDLESGEIETFSTLADMSNKLKVSTTTVSDAFRLGKAIKSKRYTVDLVS